MSLTKVASSMLTGGSTGGGGSVGKNYISQYNNGTCNGDFESGNSIGWNLCTVSSISNGLPSGLTVGAGSVATSVISTGQIAGQFSLQTIYPNVANQGIITDVFTIDTEDQAKVMTFKFYYNVTSGASVANFSGTSSNTFIVGIYAVNGSNIGWIQPAGVYSMTQSSGGSGIATGTFQTYSDATQYRFAILCANAPSASVTMVIDDVYLGPQTAPIGPVVTDWVSYTPTFTLGSGSLTNYSANAKWRRVGDSIEVMGKIIFSAASAGFSQIYASMPTGINIDSTKLTSGLQSVIGQCAALDFGIANYTGGSVFYQSANLVYLAPSAINSHVGTAPVFTPGFSNTFPITFNTNDEISWHFMAPISGWSSNVQLSNDTDTRVVSCKVGTTGNQAITTATWSKCTSLSSSALIDTHSAYDSTNKRIIFPVSGIYTILCSAVFASNGTGGRAVGYTINGAAIPSEGGAGQGGVASDQLASTYQSTVSVRAGDYVELAVYQSSGGNLNLIGGTLQAFRLSGPSVIAASETVAARYGKTATQSFSAETKLTGYTRVFDTHAAWDSSNNWYRFPVSGKYLIEIQTNAIPGSNGAQVTAYRINGGVISYYLGTDSSISVQARFGGSTVINVNAGDYIEFYHFTNVSTTVQPNEQNTHFTITRLGN